MTGRRGADDGPGDRGAASGGGSEDDPRDDRALLGAHVAGDTDAFAVLFRRHRDRLWAVALRTTGDPEEAADALQDALVNAFRRAASYREDAAVTTWLHRVVVNACLDRHRRRQVRRADPLPEAEEQHRAGDPALRSPESESPEARSESSERGRRVRAALASLSPEQRAALVLVDMEGYSVDEASRILDVAPGTVKSRCSRGRARLAPLLRDLRDPSGNPEDPSRVPPVDVGPRAQAPAPGRGGAAPPA